MSVEVSRKLVLVFSRSLGSACGVVQNHEPLLAVMIARPFYLRDRFRSAEFLCMDISESSGQPSMRISKQGLSIKAAAAQRRSSNRFHKDQGVLLRCSFRYATRKTSRVRMKCNMIMFCRHGLLILGPSSALSLLLHDIFYCITHDSDDCRPATLGLGQELPSFFPT